MKPSASFSSVVKWSDLAALQTQLKMQNQAIESLIQKFREMEREKESQRCHIQTLQGKPLHCYWLNFASKLCRRELENLQGEVDSLKTRLRRQEEDTFYQQSETRRRFENSFKTLDELTDSCRAQSTELVKTVSQHSQTKEEVRAPPFPPSHSREVRVKEAGSDSEDSSLTPSLAEVSSDDLAWLDDRDPGEEDHSLLPASAPQRLTPKLHLSQCHNVFVHLHAC
ncbi:unnamed protein product [Tetraodon nigroviridis]|uniref:(spotted green pufferfish) hypothetical protein n=1 Tax=Tetraodon nigroviridis TaxID=99883 RepID=Q4SCE9_TETNG|nr:unnamed protein product [Tetraodon nigroviridis]